MPNSEHESQDKLGMAYSERESDDKLGTANSEHESDDKLRMTNSERESDDKLGTANSEHESDDKLGMSYSASGHETPVVQTPGGTPEDGSPEDEGTRDLGRDEAMHNEPTRDGLSREELTRDHHGDLEPQLSTDSDISSPTSIAGNPKVKLLVRSHALCDDASPPPAEDPCVLNLCTPNNTTTATLTVASLSPTPSHKAYRRLEKDGSQSSMSEGGTSPCLSRDSSVETQYTDSTGIDLEEFIKMTLNKNAKDKMMLLKLEQDLSSFIKDSKHEYLKFPQMTSYHRMLVHRVAAFFGLDHNVDQSGKCVIVNRTSNTRLPDFKFQDHANDSVSQDETPKKQILKRESASFDEGRGSSRYGMDGKKSKSFEEREQNYNQARARIFNEETATAENSGMLESPITVDVSRTTTLRHSSARSSKEDLRWAAEPRPWSSTDSSGYGTDTSSKTAKVAGMTKASSFGGVGVTVLSRSDSRTSNNSGGHISKTTTSDSLSSGVSSLGSPMTRPPPIPSSPPPDSQSVSESSSSSHSAPSPSHLHPNSGENISPGGVLPHLPFTMEGGHPVAVWVASSLDTIPAGSVLINPQTGQPYTNPDGSVYRYQPSGTRQHQSSPQQQSPLPVQPQQQQSPQQQVGQQSYTQFNPPQVMVRSADQKVYTPAETPGDMSQSFSQLTLTHQSSTELAEPPGGNTQHQQAQQQQMYLLTSPGQPSSGQPGLGPIPQPQPQQMQPQQGYMQPQQVQYYTSPPSSVPQVHIMYPNMTYNTSQGTLHTQGSIEGQPQGQPPPSTTSQYSGQSYVQGYGTQRTTVPSAQSSAPPGGNAYQMMPGYPSMGPSGDGYQPSTPGSYQPGGPTTYQQPTDHGVAGGPPGGYSGAQYPATPVSCAPSGSQPGYVQQQTHGSVYYSSTTPCTNGASAGLSSVSFPATMAAQGGQGSYRPRTPPSQGGTGNVGSVGPSVSVNGVGVMGVSASGQYVSYPGPSAAPYPQPVQQQPQQRPQMPQVVPFQPMPHTHSPPQPPFPVVRPNMQMSMQMQTRTTPPPPGPGGQYSHVAMVPASPQQVKIYGVDQRPPKSVDLYNPEMNKDGGALTLPGPQVVAIPKGGVAVGVRTAGPPYRAPTPMCPADVRLQLTTQPLQPQFARPQLQPLFQTRPARLPAVSSQSTSPSLKAQKGRKLWTRASHDSSSQHSSTESTHSSDLLTCALAGGAVLEVMGLHPGLSRSDLEMTCDDLVKLGARLHLPQDSSSGQWPEPTALAVFDSVATAQRALQNHKTVKYRLRDSTQQEPPS